MNVFQQCWKNWTRHPFGQPDPGEHGWLNELNQAVFSALEKKLQGRVRVKSVLSPAFFYHTEAVDGSGVDSHAATVSSYRVVLPDGTFEERVDSAVDQLVRMVEWTRVKTVFFYSPIVPLGSHNVDGTVNRRHMSIRLKVTGATVDVGHQSIDGNT